VVAVAEAFYLAVLVELVAQAAEVMAVLSQYWVLLVELTSAQVAVEAELRFHKAQLTVAQEL
jgi:hypothetical protein